MYYGDSGLPIHIEDRTLAHLKVVIATKLRRDESFTLSWRHPSDEREGRSTVWLQPSIPLMFTFEEPRGPELDRAWIESLTRSANSTGGLTLVPQDGESTELAAEQPGPAHGEPAS